jgi:hypothetical protein
MRFDHGSTAATTDEGGLRRIQEFHIGTFVLVLRTREEFLYSLATLQKKTSFPPCAQPHDRLFP